MNPLTSDDKPKESLEDLREINSDSESDAAPEDEGSQCSDNEEEAMPDVFQHPLFQYDKDDILSHLIRVLKPLLGPNPNTEGLEGRLERFGSLLFRAIFENRKVSELQMLFQQFDIMNKTTCGEQIPAGTFYFRCLDCERGQNEQSVSVLCDQCFDNSNHEGHRTIFVRVSEDDEDNGFCDCGDPESINPGGFCSSHQSNEINGEEILKKLPQAQVKKCQMVLTKALYGAVSLFEIASKLKKGPNFEAVLELSRGLLDEVLICLQNSYLDISHCFVPIISAIFQSQFTAPMNKLWHNCDEFTTQVNQYGIQVNELSQCKCSILGSLFRVSSLFSEDEQVNLQTIIMACMKVSKFKDFSITVVTRYSQVMFPLLAGKNKELYTDPSRLFTLNRVFLAETLVLKVIETGYFENYTNIIHKLLEKNKRLSPHVQKAIIALETILCGIINPNYRNSTGKIIKETTIMKDLLEALTTLQKKFFYEGKISFETEFNGIKFNTLGYFSQCEKLITMPLESCLRYISECPSEEKVHLLKELTKEWFKQYSSLQALQEEKVKDDHIRLSLGLERLLCYIILSYNNKITLQNLREFFETFLPEIEIEGFSRGILESVLKHFGMIRSIITNHEKAYGKLYRGYYRRSQMLYDFDILLIQMMVLLVNPDDLIQSLTKSFFSYNDDLRTFCQNYDPESLGKNEENKKKITVLKDFIHFLIYIMNDEISQVNINSRNASHQEMEEDAQRTRIIERIAVNTLLTGSWTDVSDIKNIVFNLLYHDNAVDNVIAKISTFDHKESITKIKDGYKPELDPYIFFKSINVQKKIFEDILLKDEFKKLDLVSGKFYENLPDHLKILQNQFYRSDLPAFLSNLLIKLTKETHLLIRPLLKLILLNLQVAHESLKKDEPEKQGFLHKVEENYFKDSFIMKLDELVKQEEFNDCRLCIERIWKMIQEISTYSEHKLTQVIKIPQEVVQNGKEEENGDSVPKTESNEIKEVEQVEKKDLTCTHCLEIINEVSDLYGVPVYVTFTNNFYDSNKPAQMMQYLSLKGAPWWPVLSSCNHYYHKECFDVVVKNAQSYYKENFKGIFRENFEACCSSCKILCNNFMIVNRKLAKNSENELESSVDIQDRRFFHQIEVLWNKMIDKLTGFYFKFSEKDKFNLLQLSTKKAYDYFIEAFHLYNQSADLKKSFELYSLFFKSLKFSYFERKESTTQEVFTFFGHLWEQFGTGDVEAEQVLAYQSERLRNVLFANVIIHSFLNENQSKQEEILKKVHFNILKEYLQFNIVQMLALEKNNTTLTLKECVDLFQNDQSLRSKILNELIFPLKKIILSFCLNNCVLLDTEPIGNNTASLLLNPNLCIQELNDLLNQTGICDNLELMLNEVVQELDVKFGPATEILKIMLLPKDTSLIGVHKIAKMAPSIISLPQTYLEFNNIYLKRKCFHCGLHSTELKLCLICGEVLCLSGCFGEVSLGNLNKHALDNHMGFGLFFDRVDFYVEVTDSPLQVSGIGRNIYINNIGQPIDEAVEYGESLPTLDFKKYTLNPQFKEEVESILKHQRIGQYLFDMRIFLGKEDEENFGLDGIW